MITTNGIIVEDGSTGTPNITSLVSGSANTFGSWTAIDASTSADSWIAGIMLTPPPGSISDYNKSFCIEIGTGSVGSEVTKIRVSGYMVAYMYTDVGMAPSPCIPIMLSIPIKVASGTRIAARFSSSNSSSVTAKIGLCMYQGIETVPDVNVVSQNDIDFGATQKASIKTQAVAALDDANTELAAIPDTTGSLRKMLQFLFQFRRNKLSQTHTTQTMYKEDGSTALGSADCTDDGETFTRGEMTSA